MTTVIHLPHVEDWIAHECAPRFVIEVLQKYLPDYTLHEPHQDKHPEKTLMLSQHLFGWPAHRPRRYSVLTRNQTCEMPSGIDHIGLLFRKPCLSVDAFFSAPQAGPGIHKDYKGIHRHIDTYITHVMYIISLLTLISYVALECSRVLS